MSRFVSTFKRAFPISSNEKALWILVFKRFSFNNKITAICLSSEIAKIKKIHINTMINGNR